MDLTIVARDGLVGRDCDLRDLVRSCPSPLPVRFRDGQSCSLGALAKTRNIQLTLEPYRFELCGSNYIESFFNKYCKHVFMVFFLKIFYLSLERRKRRKTGRETSVCKRYINQLSLACPRLGTRPTTQAHALTGNHTDSLSVHRTVLNPLSHIQNIC